MVPTPVNIPMPIARDHVHDMPTAARVTRKYSKSVVSLGDYITEQIPRSRVEEDAQRVCKRNAVAAGNAWKKSAKLSAKWTGSDTSSCRLPDNILGFMDFADIIRE
jgi:hypothetical protein